MAIIQSIEKAKGRPILQWAGKKPLDKIEYFPAQEKEVYGDKDSINFNKLFWGDNLHVLSHLLKEYRARINLIYIDPPFGTGVDYFKKIKIRGEEIKGTYSLLEEKQYANVFNENYYLQFMYERLQIMRELLADNGSIWIRIDYHFSHYLKCVLDEIFGKDNFINEISVNRTKKIFTGVKGFNVAFDSLLIYQKTNLARIKNVGKKGREIKWLPMHSPGIRHPKERKVFDRIFEPPQGRHWTFTQQRIDQELLLENRIRISPKNPEILEYLQGEIELLNTDWSDIAGYTTSNTGYPTENSEALLERVILSGSEPDDLIADFFVGSGTTPAVAQKLNRQWLSCDINLGSIQTTTKRLSNIVNTQSNSGFKVYNVNDYDIFKNEMEAKSIILETYGVEEIRNSFFDGILDNHFVKVVSPNRILNKLDIKNILKSIEDKIESFTVKSESHSKDSIYEEGVYIICSGMEPELFDYLKTENSTGVKIEIKDLSIDRQNLIFKKKPEAIIQTQIADKKLKLRVEEFFSPILIRKLEIENEKAFAEEYKTKIDDFRQIIDSISIDIDYNNKLFNPEIIDLPNKKELIKADYEWEYRKSGDYLVAIKIVDVLGEEYFETHKISV